MTKVTQLPFSAVYHRPSYTLNYFLTTLLNLYNVGFGETVYLDNFDVVGGLEWSNDPESYAGGSVATDRASLAKQVKGDDPD
jgi:hypothetical protein